MIPGIRVCVRAPDSAARDDNRAGAGWNKGVSTYTCLGPVSVKKTVCPGFHVPPSPPPWEGRLVPKQMFPKCSDFKPEIVRLEREAVVCNQIHPPVMAVMD